MAYPVLTLAYPVRGLANLATGVLCAIVLFSFLGNVLSYLSAQARSAPLTLQEVVKMDAASGGAEALAGGFREDPTLSIDDSKARALQSKMRVFCWVPAREKDLQWRVRAINQTWVRRCDGHVFFIQMDWPDAWPDIVALGPELEGWDTLSAKSAAAIVYLYHHYLREYDWFLKADDNSYVIMENLRLLLSKYDPAQPVYLGQLYDEFPKGGPGFMGGGAGFVLSREALRMAVEEGYEKGKCPVTEGHGEDRHIGNCLYNAGVGRHSSRDIYGREAFHQFSPQQYIVDPGLAQHDIQHYFKFPQSIGRECCSEATISFHYVDPDMILVLDHLFYRLSVYGRLKNMDKLQDLFEAKTVPMP